MKTVILAGIIAALTAPGAFAAVELAKIGSKSITDQYVKDAMEGLPQGQKQQLNNEDSAKMRVIENMVVEELFVQEGEKAGIAKDPEFVKAIDRARRQLLAQRFLQKHVQPKITDANVKDFFEKNKNRYSQDEVKASHILVKTEAEAKEVYAKAKGGEDFQVLAKKYSTDPSAAQNMGDLGYFTRSRMVPEFAEQAFKMKTGEISEPVKTVFGYHIIKVTDTRKGKAVSFNDVKDQVRADYQNMAVSELIDSLKKKNNVVVHEDKIKSFKF
jgi:peptidyl-prolyl cis-trans isomerase C